MHQNPQFRVFNKNGELQISGLMKKLLIPSILLILLSACSQKDKLEYPHYDVKVSLIPGEQYIAVSGILKIPVESINGPIEFYLHKQLKIEQLLINGRDVKRLSAVESDNRYMPDAKKYTFKKGMLLRRTATINFNYSGTITEWNELSSSVIGEEWTEMGLYFPWYPFNRAYSPFSYEVEVNTDGNYHTFMMGRETSDVHYAIYRTEQPTNDMVVCAAKDLKTISKTVYMYNLKLAHTSFSDELANTLTSDIESIMSIFNRWFPTGDSDVCLVESMRENGVGYARLGGIYLPGLNEADYFASRKAYIRYLAHEISHLWWHRADPNTWEDWLNEGFAEYSALMVLRELYGNDCFDDWIANKEKQSESVSPVWQLDRDGDEAYTILYDKAPLLLHELEGKIGSRDFQLLMWSMIRNEVSTTENFLAILEQRQGTDIKDWFTTRLKNY